MPVRRLCSLRGWRTAVLVFRCRFEPQYVYVRTPIRARSGSPPLCSFRRRRVIRKDPRCNGRLFRGKRPRMPTSIAIVLAIAGAVLIVVGAMGGGFTLAAATVPAVGVFPRVLSFCVGAALIATSMYVFREESNKAEAQDGPGVIVVPQPASTPGQVTIYNAQSPPAPDSSTGSDRRPAGSHRRARRLPHQHLLGPRLLGSGRRQPSARLPGADPLHGPGGVGDPVRRRYQQLVGRCQYR